MNDLNLKELFARLSATDESQWECVENVGKSGSQHWLYRNETHLLSGEFHIVDGAASVEINGEDFSFDRIVPLDDITRASDPIGLFMPKQPE
jgi:hypothetical protein